MKNYKFTINGNQYDVDVVSLEENIVEVEVNGTPYKVELEQEVTTTKTPKLIRGRTPAPPSKLQPLTTLGQVKAPLPGAILEIKVKEGEKVKKDQLLLVMEAMKMENKVLSERDGTVKSIKVAVGDNVLQGDTLVEIE